MKINKWLIILLSGIFSNNFLSAQVFIGTGKITYERRVNLAAYFDSQYGSSSMQGTNQFHTDIFTLQFDNRQSIYRPVGSIRSMIYSRTAVDDVIFTNFDKDYSVSQKNVFEKTFLITDSLTPIKWKIKDDFREIAGFNCRRATAVLFDSVFVVAFYTDEILIPGGPENFHGLPGTILGLVVNKLHTTWYATKVELEKNDKTITPPSSGIKVNRNEFTRQLTQNLKSWEGLKNLVIWNCSL